ncbi:TPA: hypothetical protein DEP21_03505 [Patescibacteria group bacterium]|nr:hypothetical protein [Candidatus Gracilibacteria bacterium]
MENKTFKSSNPFITLTLEISKLNEILRRGYEERGVPHEFCESQSDYLYSTTMLAWTTAENNPDLQHLSFYKIIKYALISVIGRVTYHLDKEPFQGQRTLEQQQKERNAVVRLFAGLANQQEYIALYDSFWKKEDEESRFVHDVRKLQMRIMAANYYCSGYTKCMEFLDEPYESAFEELNKIADTLINVDFKNFSEAQIQN